LQLHCIAGIAAVLLQPAAPHVVTFNQSVERIPSQNSIFGVRVAATAHTQNPMHLRCQHWQLDG
jgi:hypothetical protein